MKRTTAKATAALVALGVVLIAGDLAGVGKFARESFGALGMAKSSEVYEADSKEKAKTDQNLLDEIKRRAEAEKQEPVDAVNDRVWKAIPGYNGLEIDVAATYAKTMELRKKNPAQAAEPDKSIAYVYREVKPAKSLADLGPLPIYRGNPRKPMAALMINVAWGNEYIEPMLDTLDAEGVKATFFLDGSWLSKNADMAKEIQRRGHEIENHAYTHPNMSRLSAERATLEIVKTKQLLKDTLGVDNQWFAPPSGDFNQRTVEIAAAQGLATVLWTVDTVDWRNPDPSAVVAKIGKQAGPGSLILMHPTASTKQSLQGMIRVLKQKGLKLGTVAETLSSDRVESPKG